MRRIASLDVVRGVGILGVIYLHSVVFYYGDFMSIDFDNPPLVIAVIAIMVLMGGIFGVVSGAANTYMARGRSAAGRRKQGCLHLVHAGVFLLAAHYLYNVFLGPHTHNFETGEHSYSLVALSIRNGGLTLPGIERLFEGSALSMLGWNLILLGLILSILFRDNGIRTMRRNRLILGVGGAAVVAVSVVRIYLLPMVESSIESGRYGLATVLSFFVAKPYPLLPYLAFALFGAVLALSWMESRGSVRRMAWLGFGWLVLGGLGFLVIPQSIAEVDMFWFAKVLFELGIFIVLVCLAMLAFDRPGWRDRVPWLRRLGRVSFTVYIVQTPLSELLAKGLDVAMPGWNMTIPAMLVFGVVNVAVWLLIIAAWARHDFRFSLEWLWVRILKPSSKMDNLP